MQNSAADQVTAALKEANNVLVTVKNSPSVDELTASIALTLMLNRMGKHAITVFSGDVPSILEFLQPEMAIDTNTDSLRDFIIALDKSKADKLRYKVEDNVVRIFITPYKTSISDKDLEFSQGDFNVDVVVALGVVTKEDFDQAVTVHGRILHDATVVALTKNEAPSEIGSINWYEQQASSISEMITSIASMLGDDVLDGQIATALMTGIVAETDRFRNEHTTPRVLALSAQLMSAGANQQLIAQKLEEQDSRPIPQVRPIEAESGSLPAVVVDDGALEIIHEEEDGVQNIHIDDSGNLGVLDDDIPPIPERSDYMKEPAAEDRSYIQHSEPPKLYAQDDSGKDSAQPLLVEKPVALPPSQSQEPALYSQRKVIEPIVVGGEVESRAEEIKVSDPKPVEPTLMPIPIPIPIQPAKNIPVPQPIAAPKEISKPPAPAVLAPDQHGSKTLTDLEISVKSPHVAIDSTAATQSKAEVKPLEEAKKPESSAPTPQVVSSTPPPPPPTPIPTPAPPLVPVPATPPPPASAPPLIPIPTVIDKTIPPPGPPPLMPQKQSQPQFFEADGKKSNPFLNPSA